MHAHGSGRAVALNTKWSSFIDTKWSSFIRGLHETEPLALTCERVPRDHCKRQAFGSPKGGGRWCRLASALRRQWPAAPGWLSLSLAVLLSFASFRYSPRPSRSPGPARHNRAQPARPAIGQARSRSSAAARARIPEAELGAKHENRHRRPRAARCTS